MSEIESVAGTAVAGAVPLGVAALVEAEAYCSYKIQATYAAAPISRILRTSFIASPNFEISASPESGVGPKG